VAVIATIAVLLFVGIDLALVVLALLWLSDRRAANDRTDMRYAERRKTIRYR
jgi:hypothetical protein